MVSFSKIICNPSKWGLKDSYTLLGSKHFINSFEKNNLSCILLENTNAVVKIGRRMCVTCLFGVHDLSLLSTKYVALRTNYNTETAQHKHTIQTKHNQHDKQLKSVGSTF
jgi:hypothetical protein